MVFCAVGIADRHLALVFINRSVFESNEILQFARVKAKISRLSCLHPLAINHRHHPLTLVEAEPVRWTGTVEMR